MEGRVSTKTPVYCFRTDAECLMCTYFMLPHNNYSSREKYCSVFSESNLEKVRETHKNCNAVSST